MAVRRVSYVFLCIVPFLSFVVVGVRAFRVPGVYQAVGVAYFAAIAVATIMLSGPLYLIWITFAFGAGFGKRSSSILLSTVCCSTPLGSAVLRRV